MRFTKMPYQKTTNRNATYPQMKPIALLALAVAISPVITAQTEPVDTVKIIENAQRIMIIRNGNNTVVNAIIDDGESAQVANYIYEVTVEESSDSIKEEYSENLFSTFPFLSEKKKRKASATKKFTPRREITGLRNIYWGWNFAYDGKASIRNCFEVGVAEVIAVEWHPWHKGPDFRVGAGFGMKRFLTADNNVFTKEGDCLTLLNIDPAWGACDVKSRWDVWTFHVPLMMSQRIAHDIGVAFGALLNFNTYSKARTQMEIDGTRYRETFKGLQQRLFTVELVGIFGLRGGIGVYAKWSPMPIMRTIYGPEFKSWTLGATLNF